MEWSEIIALVAAFISFVALIVTIKGNRSAKRYTEEQIDLIRKRFIADITPDVEFDILNRKIKGSSDFDLYLKVTNHSPSISVNNINVVVTCEPENDFEGFALSFLIPETLNPGHSIERESIPPFKIIEKKFPPNTVDYYSLEKCDSRLLQEQEFEKYSVLITLKYLPRYKGAIQIKKKMEKCLLVKRK